MFELDTELEDIISGFAYVADDSDVELIVDLAPDLPGHVRGDSLRLRQVIVNLLGNAFKFTENGWVSIAAWVESSDIDTCTVRFEVTDTGIGIPEDAAESLFRPFSQADGSMTRKYGGTGLGLAISQKLVAAMGGGRIDIQSRPGKGSSMAFSARLERAPDSEATVISPLDALADVRVLVIEDNDVIRASIGAHFSDWGMAPTLVADVKDAVEVLRAGKPADEGKEAVDDADVDSDAGDSAEPDADDVSEPAEEPAGQGDIALILADMDPRDRESIELVKTMREQGLGDVPIVLMVALRDLSLSIDAGIHARLSKPIRPSQLQECVRAALLNETPAAQMHGTSSAGTPTILPNDASDANAPAVLVVEDNKINRIVMRALLRQLGFRADMAHGGHDALKALQASHRYSAVLMDCQMPEMDGYEATKRIRVIEEENGIPRIPIIATTAHAMKGDRERAIDAGMDDYVTKPIALEALREALVRCIKRANYASLNPDDDGAPPQETSSSAETSTQEPVVASSEPGETKRASSTPATASDATGDEAGRDVQSEPEAASGESDIG